MHGKARYTFFENFCLEVKPPLLGSKHFRYALYKLPAGAKPETTRAPLSLLELLTSHPGQTFDHDVIVKKLATSAGDQGTLIRKQVGFLRKFVNDEGRPYKLIVSDRSLGYLFAGNAATHEGVEGEREWRNRGFANDEAAQDAEKPEGKRPSSETSLSAAETRAERQAQLLSSQVGRAWSFNIPRLFQVATFPVTAAVLLWLFVRYRVGALSSLVFGIGALGLLVVAFLCIRLIRHAESKKVIIRVARLGTDQHGKDVRELVMYSIEDVIGRDVVRIEWAEVDFSMALEDRKRSFAEARRFLKKDGCDVLIWGKVYSLEQKEERLLLRFSTPDFDRRPDAKFEFTPNYSLDAGFGPELGLALAAVAGSMALPATANSGPILATALEPLADKLSTVIGGFDKLNAVDRAAMLQAYGLIQSALGGQLGDESRLEVGIDTLRTATTLLPRGRLPLSWAFAQNTLGMTLFKQGSLQVGTDRLHEAAAAFEEALTEMPGDELPVARGLVLYNLGMTQWRIGERESGSDRLNQALELLRKALEGVKENPRLAATVQLVLAVNLFRMGEREKGRRRFSEGINFANEASITFSREWMRPQWAMAEATIADGLGSLGTRLRQIETLSQSVAAFKRAARVLTRRRAPLQWLNLQLNLATTLISQGEIDPKKSVAPFHEAVKVLNAVIDDHLRSKNPNAWARAHHSLGVALFKLAEREEGIAYLQSSKTAFEKALEEWTQDRAPEQWALATNGLASTLLLRGKRQGDAQKLHDAIKYFRQASKICTPESNLLQWSYAQNDLAQALVSFGAQESLPGALEEAVEILEGVLASWTSEPSSEIVRYTRENLEFALSILMKRPERAVSEEDVQS